MDCLFSVMADSTPSAVALRDFLQVGFYLLVGAVALKTVLTRKPSHGELATKAEMEQLRLEIKGDDEKIHRRLGAITEKLADTVGTLKSCVDDVKLLKERMLK